MSLSYRCVNKHGPRGQFYARIMGPEIVARFQRYFIQNISARGRANFHDNNAIFTVHGRQSLMQSTLPHE